MIFHYQKHTVLNYWPRTDHACPQKPNPSRETFPLIIAFTVSR
jgi:hypothetical protein